MVILYIKVKKKLRANFIALSKFISTTVIHSHTLRLLFTCVRCLIKMRNVDKVSQNVVV